MQMGRTIAEEYPGRVCECCGRDTGRAYDYAYEDHDVLICKECRNSERCGKPEVDHPNLPGYPEEILAMTPKYRYASITKATAKAEFMLTDEELERLPYKRWKPRESMYNTLLYLFMRVQVAMAAIAKYGSLAAVEEEKQKAEARRLDRRVKQREKQRREQHEIAKATEKYGDAALAETVILMRRKNQKKARNKAGGAEAEEEEDVAVPAWALVEEDQDVDGEDEAEAEALRAWEAEQQHEVTDPSMENEEEEGVVEGRDKDKRQSKRKEAAEEDEEGLNKPSKKKTKSKAKNDASTATKTSNKSFLVTLDAADEGVGFFAPKRFTKGEFHVHNYVDDGDISRCSCGAEMEFETI